MAEGLLRHLSNGQMFVESAGTHPSFVHPLAIEVMQEIGIDISSHRSKSVDEFVGQDFDYLITVCDNAREACPVFPGAKKTLHMPFDDPIIFGGTKDERKVHFRSIRDQISEKMNSFLSKFIDHTI